MQIICCETRDGYEYINSQQIIRFHDCEFMPGYVEMWLTGDTLNKVFIKGNAEDIARKLGIAGRMFDD